MVNTPGLLWFDNDPKRDWRQKVIEAGERYRKKLWLQANLCLVNAPQRGLYLGLSEKSLFVETINGIDVYAVNHILPDNYWATRKEDKPAVSAAVTVATQYQLALWG